MFFHRLLVGDPVEWLVASPVYLVIVLSMVSIAAFRQREQGRLHRYRYPILAVLVLVTVTTVPALSHGLVGSLESRYPPLAPVAGNDAGLPIVVLASGSPYERNDPDPLQLDLASLRRTVAAAAWHRQLGGSLYFVGSAWPREPDPIAGRMARLARRLGVPSESIHVVPGSTNTRENFLSLATVLDKTSRFILVTSAWHMPRAMGVARRLGWSPIPAPCDYRTRDRLTWRAWFPNNNASDLMVLGLHERLGILYYRLRGWI
ncbi:MAG: YdcF family protein [Gammaproteobacteria bacterium]|jgi:uncharacterized SAM-binding protein YcdF (DUF218 family)